MMTQAQALGDIRYDKVKLTSKPKVKTAYDPPMWTKSRNSRYIGCLLLVLSCWSVARRIQVIRNLKFANRLFLKMNQ